MSDMATVVGMSAKSGLTEYATQDGERCSGSETSMSVISELREEWARERLVRHAAQSLGRLDDSTLRDLGISHRSMIEFTVRYCLEC